MLQNTEGAFLGVLSGCVYDLRHVLCQINQMQSTVLQWSPFLHYVACLAPAVKVKEPQWKFNFYSNKTQQGPEMAKNVDRGSIATAVPGKDKRCRRQTISYSLLNIPSLGFLSTLPEG